MPLFVTHVSLDRAHDLQRNLVHHGGFLDEVIFLQRTAVQEDIDWLHTTVSNTPGYTIANYTEERGGDYSHSWDLCEPGTMYIKIDDDIVFIEDTAIPAIVNTKLSNPHSLLVSANAVNQPALAWTHHHLGVVKPYLPELTPIPGPNPRPTYDWRASDLPDWQGPLSFIVPNDFSPPFPYHRWLPARHLNNTDDTPISTATYTLDGTGWSSWTVAAQQHYSFLEHLEKGELWRYRFTMWDYHYDRLSTNFMCIWGDDIIAIKDGMGEDDEGYMTTVATRKLGRRMSPPYSLLTQAPSRSSHSLGDIASLTKLPSCRCTDGW
jgi:hypothetical protein